MRILKILIATPFIFLLITIVAASFHPDSYYRIGRGMDLCFPGHPGFSNWWYDRAASLGHTEAQSYAGMYYLFGFGPQDKKKGLQYLKLAAEKDDVYALSSLASAYEWGLGVKQDFARSVELTEEIIKSKNDKGDPFNFKTRSHLAFLLTVCPPPIQDFDRAFKIYSELEEKAYQETNPAEYVGFYHYFGLNSKRDPLEAARHLKLASKLGSGQARAVLGNIYLAGDGVKRDYKEAHEILVKSARQGEFYAMELIAIAHTLNLPEFKEDGSVDKWIDILVSGGYDSFSYLKDKQFETSSSGLKQMIAAAKSDPRAATICGVIYLFGVEVKQSEAQAYHYLDRAMAMGSEDAKVVKANFIFDNPKNRKQFDEALRLLEDGWKHENKACGVQLAMKKSGGTVCEQDWELCYKILSGMDLKDHGYARFLLGQCYLYGMGTKRDVKKGLSQLLQAAKEGSTSSALYIYDNYSTFDSADRIEVDMDEILKLASDLEVPEATYKLAMRTTDQNKANALLEKAAQGGYVKAQIELGERYWSGKLKDGKITAADYYKMASEAGSKKALQKFEKRQIEEFKDKFKRDPDSKEVLVATRDLKKGQVFTRDSFKISKGNFVLGTYLDGQEESVKFLVGKHCYGDVKEGSEISIYDVGVSEP